VRIEKLRVQHYFDEASLLNYAMPQSYDRGNPRVNLLHIPVEIWMSRLPLSLGRLVRAELSGLLYLPPKLPHLCRSLGVAKWEPGSEMNSGSG
jgi:hypothetical protein